MELEKLAIPPPWAQGVASSNLAAPTNNPQCFSNLPPSRFGRSRNLCALVCNSRRFFGGYRPSAYAELIRATLHSTWWSCGIRPLYESATIRPLSDPGTSATRALGVTLGVKRRRPRARARWSYFFAFFAFLAGSGIKLQVETVSLVGA